MNGKRALSSELLVLIIIIVCLLILLMLFKPITKMLTGGVA